MNRALIEVLRCRGGPLGFNILPIDVFRKTALFRKTSPELITGLPSSSYTWNVSTYLAKKMNEKISETYGKPPPRKVSPRCLAFSWPVFGQCLANTMVPNQYGNIIIRLLSFNIDGLRGGQYMAMVQPLLGQIAISARRWY